MGTDPYLRIESGRERADRSALPDESFWRPSMKPMVIVGVILAALGAFVLMRGMSFNSDRSVIRMGGMEASVQERQSVPPWIGVVAVVGGVVLIANGLRGRKS